jgi:hypothetical protein
VNGGGSTGGGGRAGGTGGGQGGDAAGLLGDLALLRRRARADRHGYWSPLLLFGVLALAASPLYLAAARAPVTPGMGVYSAVRNTGPVLLSGPPHGPDGFYLGWYWAGALVAGYLSTVLWYRHRARRAGVRTPVRGYLLTGLALTVLAVLIPPLTGYVRWLHLIRLLWQPISDAWIRGTFAFLIIAAGLWVLAGAERSRALLVIALTYSAIALLTSLYDVQNVLFSLGWNPHGSHLAWQFTQLAGVVLPGMILLAAGAAALLAQRRGPA